MQKQEYSVIRLVVFSYKSKSVLRINGTAIKLRLHKDANKLISRHFDEVRTAEQSGPGASSPVVPKDTGDSTNQHHQSSFEYRLLFFH